MTVSDLEQLYRRYIDCLNRKDWPSLGLFVSQSVCHNSRPFGLAGYRAMLEQDFRDIPDLRFTIGLVICSATHVAARLDFRCSPAGDFLGLPVNGRTVTFSENVIYQYQDGRICEVWSVVDKMAIEAQL